MSKEECCSQYGWCGHSEKHCSIDQGCQSEFGHCTTTDTTPISTDGRCGKEYGKCPSDECCSKYGWCGHSEQHCSIDQGCLSEFGKCNVNTSTNGRCGKEYGKCPKNECCSKYGWCGHSEQHCSVDQGCKSEFGKCTSTNTKISTNGQCDKEHGRCPSGSCCSKYGWCGKTSDYCGSGCQSEFGECN